MDVQLYQRFYDIEKVHWWFVARRQILLDVIARLALPTSAKLLDVGCGAGAFLEGFSQGYEAYGIDASALAIGFCRQRGLQNVFSCTLENFPRPEMRFDLITLLDVIEHIEDDQRALDLVRERLLPGGFVVVTVPAYRWLWSRWDELNHHRRRYAQSQLRERLERAGFAVQTLSYFNSLLFPCALFSRLISKLFKLTDEPGAKIPARSINALMTWIFAVEKFWLRRFRFPAGLSLIAIAQNPSTFEGVSMNYTPRAA